MEVPFHDGGGLPSPGRWRQAQRRAPTGMKWEEAREEIEKVVLRRMGSRAELEKEFFRMTKGGDAFKLVKDEAVIEEVRRVLAEKFGYAGSVCPEPGRPFMLGLMETILRQAGDCDHKFLGEAVDGLPLGVLHPLPRTPGVYERQTKWSLELDMDASWAMEKENYSSGATLRRRWRRAWWKR